MNELVRNKLLALMILLPVTLSAMGFPERETVEFRGIHEIEISAAIFDVEVRAGSSSETTIEVLDIPSGFTVESREKQGSAQLYVQGRPPVFGDIPGAPRIIVDVPATVALRVDASTGDIRVNGMRGFIDLSSRVGEISLSQSSGTIKLQTDSGGQEIRQCTGIISSLSSSGGITLEEFHGVSFIEARSGSIVAQDMRITGNVSFTASTGNIDVSFRNAPADLRFDLHSSSGSISMMNEDYYRLSSGPAARFVVYGESVSGNQTYR